MLLAAIRKEMQLLCRDLHGLAVLFVMPIAFMLIMSVALSRDEDPHEGARIVLAGADTNPLNAPLAEALQKRGLTVDTETLPASEKQDDAQPDTLRQLQDGKIALILRNPNTTADALHEEQPLQLLVRPGADRGWLAGIDGVVREEYTQLRVARMQEESVAVEHPQQEIRGQQENRRRQQQRQIEQAVRAGMRDGLRRELTRIGNYLKQPRTEIRYTAAGKPVSKPSSVQHSVPAWLIFGMFFILIPLSNVMAMERQTNTLTRLRMAQAPASLLLLSKLLPYFVINQLQFAGMVMLGKYLLPLLGIDGFSLTDPLWPWLLLASATSLAALGYGLLVAVLARSTEHAVVLGGGGIIIMAALGGIMVPVHVMPEAMQTMTLLSPMGWSLRAFQALLLDHASFIDISQFVAALCAAGLVCLTLASFFHHRQLKTLARF